MVKTERDLTDKQELFAVAYVKNGGNCTQAAVEAGYAPNSCRVIGSRLSRNSTVQRLIRDEQHRVIGGRLCSQALGVLESIMLDPGAPSGARVDACKTILDRGGIPAVPAASIIQIGDEKPLVRRSLAELDAFIAQGQKRLTELDMQKAALNQIGE